MEQLGDIATKASKEWGIENDLKQMYEEWKPISFLFSAFRNTGTFIIKNFMNAIELLDEHSVLTTGMMYSPYKKVFEEEIETWNAKLNEVGVNIELWIKLQLN